MMGTKARAFAPLPPVSLEELVPADHFYRHLEATLDLAFVRELVREHYGERGRPSIDPVVFFKLQLILFFEGLRSERQLLRVVADRLSLRWYLGCDLAEALPDHSSLTRIRDRYGLAVFRRFFEAIVERCVAAGLVWGRGLYVEAAAAGSPSGRTTARSSRYSPRGRMVTVGPGPSPPSVTAPLARARSTAPGPAPRPGPASGRPTRLAA